MLNKKKRWSVFVFITCEENFWCITNLKASVSRKCDVGPTNVKEPKTDEINKVPIDARLNMTRQ